MFVRTESFKQYLRYYPVTCVLIAVNLLLVLLMEISGSSQNTMTLIQFGALFEVDGFKPELWRFVTAMFLHNGFAHLFFNCFALFVFAPALERMLGKVRYIALYLVSGIAGNIVSYWLHSDSFISVGASGAIYGIYAAYLFLAIFRKDIIDLQTKQTIVTIIVIGFLYSFIVPRVDIYGHLGGFLGGLVVMYLIALSIRRRR